MRILLDTNAYSAWKVGNATIDELIERADVVYASSIVLGELIHGYRKGSANRSSRRLQRSMRELQAFLSDPDVEEVGVTSATAERYADVLGQLLRKGKPIPANDVWIAAQALETGARLISCDRHFASIEGLSLTDFTRT